MAKPFRSWICTLGACAPGLLGSALGARGVDGFLGGDGVVGTTAGRFAGGAPIAGGAPTAPNPTQLVPLRPLPKDGPSAAVLGGKNDRHEWVDWRGQRIPLAEPVQDCTFGQSADGKMLAILAGGLRESLDLYLVDSVGGLLMRLPTYGGHCLPLAFNAGAGSLPALDGQDLVLFAFEREGRVHFRAIDPAGGVHASRELPLKVTGFRAVSEINTSKVEVAFEGADQTLRFDHPSAPVLELDPWVVSFPPTPVGERVLAAALILNKGRREVKIPLDGRAGDFGLATSGSVTIGPGQQATLMLAFQPTAAGARSGQLVLHGPRDLVIKMRGTGQAAVDGGARTLPRIGHAEPLPITRVVWQGTSAPVQPAVPKASPPPAEVVATPAIAMPAPARADAAHLAEVDGVLIVSGAPFQSFVLTALEAGRLESEARPLLGGLRGQLDAEGKCRLPLSVLGIAGTKDGSWDRAAAQFERFAVLAIVTTPGGKRVRTEAIEIKSPESR